MATKSIYKNIKIRDKKLGRSLASALENAKVAKKPKVSFKNTPERVEKDEIKKFLGIESK